MSRPRVLTVEHQANCPPALLATWLGEAGCDLDVVRPYRGDPLPVSLGSEGYDALLVLGGSMDAFDDDVPWLAPTRALVVDAAEHGVATLGVCLGHQIAAIALGGEVGRNPRGRTSGLRDLGRTTDGVADALLADVVGPGVFSNQDVVLALPTGAVELARAATGELQAARLAPTVWGVQWHPEADDAVFGTWAREDAAHHPDDGDPGPTIAAVAAAVPRLADDGRALAAALAREATSR